jgi:hypothetical protein
MTARWSESSEAFMERLRSVKAVKSDAQKLSPTGPATGTSPSLTVLTLIICSILPIPQLAGAQQSPSEYEVKAAYLFNFGRFIEWSDKSMPAKEGAFEICVLGQDPFGATLDTTLAGTSLKGKSVAAKRILKSQDINSCRILFISSSEDGRLKEILDTLQNSNVLTVSDIPGFSQRGGMIQFVVQGSKVRFEINLGSAEEAGLSVSSELLKVATNVRRNPHPGA